MPYLVQCFKSGCSSLIKRILIQDVLEGFGLCHRTQVLLGIAFFLSSLLFISIREIKFNAIVVYQSVARLSQEDAPGCFSWNDGLYKDTSDA